MEPITDIFQGLRHLRISYKNSHCNFGKRGLVGQNKLRQTRSQFAAILRLNCLPFFSTLTYGLPLSFRVTGNSRLLTHKTTVTILVLTL